MSLSKTEIIIQNIIDCSADAQRSSAEIDLLIDELISDIELTHKSISDVKHDICSKYSLLQSARRESGFRVSEYEVSREQMYICNKIATHLKREFDFGTALIQKFNSVKIAYWYSNIYAKDAYLKFERLFKSCAEIPVESFTAVCESIDDENSVLGIIPVINSADGRLMSFYRLLDKYDLKISAVCKIENPGGGGFTKFALVGKQLADIDLKKKRTIEFSTNKAVSKFMSFAEIAVATIGEITSIPSPYSDTEQLNYISILADQNAIHELWLYLYMFVGDADFIGMYSEI